MTRGLQVAEWIARAAAVAALFVLASPQPVSAQAPPAASGGEQDRVDVVEDVVVQGVRDLDQRVAGYVGAVVEPVRGRTTARWRSSFCVGVSGMEPVAARAIANQVSDWAHWLGLDIGAPGCEPNVLIVAAEDGDATASALVQARGGLFSTGVSGGSRGTAALRDFQASGRPVRWWHVSLPVDPDTGQSIRRLPGQTPFNPHRDFLTSPSQFGPHGQIVSSSRLLRGERDDLTGVVIIVEGRALDTASFGQLSDYLAMIALAPIDADFVGGGFDTILNLFSAEGSVPDTLSSWDRAFLEGLYARPAGDSEGGVAGAMRRLMNAPR